MRNNAEHIQVIQCTEHAIASLHEHSPGDAPVVMILPRHQATVRVVELPSQDTVELAQMAALAAGEMVPFSEDEIVLSSAVLQQLPDGASQVLIAVAHLDVVEQLLQQLRDAGYEAQALYLSTACLLAAIEASTPPSNDSPQAYVHIERDSMDIVIMELGSLRFNRGVEVSGDNTQTIIGEIEQALRAYTRESGASHTPPEVHISSALDMPEDFWTACETRITGCSKEDSREHVSLLSQGASALASTDTSNVIDLLPKSLKDHRVQQQVKRRYLKQFALFALMLLLVIGTFVQAIAQKKDYLAQLDKEASTLRPIAQAVMQKRAHLQRLQEQVTRTDTPYQHLGRIMAQTPQGGLTFSRFAYDHIEGITLSGRADSRERFDSLIDQLRMVGKTVYPQFAQAQSIYDRQRTEHNMDVWEYAISINFPSKNSEAVENRGGEDE